MPVLFRDYETRSTADLEAVGASVYAAHASTYVWCIAYAVDDGPVLLWHPGDPVPNAFIEAARNPDWLVVAHNDAFERQIEEKILAPQFGWPLVPIERHRCSMAQALACSLPGALEKAGPALGLTFRKDAEGRRLMKQMAKPRKARKGEDPNIIHWHNEPEKIERLGAYCVRDVEVERELSHRLPPLSESEQELWVLDAAINARGFFTDGALLAAASRIAATVDRAIQDEIARITDGAVLSTDQVAKLQAWLAGRGCAVKDVKKETLRQALRRKGLDPAARRAIELRRDAAFDTKVDTMSAHRSADGRVRGTLQFHGAGTGRWSARGVQVQNFTRDPGDVDAKIAAIMAGGAELAKRYPEPLGVIADAARGAIVAAPGHRFLIGDFSGVESRVLAWTSGEAVKLNQWIKFDQTGDQADDPYIIQAAACGLGADARQMGKTIDLAFGYQGGPGAYAKMAPDDDTTTDAERTQFKEIWRQLHPRTVSFWYNVDGAAIRAVRTPGRVHAVKCVSFEACADTETPFLKLTLPSDRIVRYPFPRIELKVPPWGGDPESRVVFMDTALGMWAPCNHGTGAYGGLWTENIVQAISRDLLAEAMQRLEAAGYPSVLTVHDEIIAEVPNGTGSLDEFKRLLVIAPAWAAGLPIAAKCREGLRYNKPGAATITDGADDNDLDDDDDDDDAGTPVEIQVDNQKVGEIEIPKVGEIQVDEAPPWVLIKPELPDIPAFLKRDKDNMPASAFKPLDAAEESPPPPVPEVCDLSAAHVVLVDATNLAHRAYHATGGPHGGTALTIFRGYLRKALREVGTLGMAPTHAGIVFDVPGPTFRHAIYSEYKANRRDDPAREAVIAMLPAMHDVARGLGLTCVEQPGFEADDVIATYARLATERGPAVTIVSSDKDLMQCVTDPAPGAAGVTVFDPAKPCRIGVTEVREKFGVLPFQVPHVLALAGDSTDNVPGVPGIGKGTAPLLIAEFGDLENLLAHADEIKTRRHCGALPDNADLARLSLRLVLLDDQVKLDVPLDELAVAVASVDDDDQVDDVDRDQVDDVDHDQGDAGNIEAPPPGAVDTPELAIASVGPALGPPLPFTLAEAMAAFERPRAEAPGGAPGLGNGHDKTAGTLNGKGPTDPAPKTDPELGPYIYQDARGGSHQRVTRTPHGQSRFTQYHWEGGAWVSGMPKRKLPYRLPELLATDPAEWVCIVEGEKDAVNVAKLGLTATTNPNGANGWQRANLVPYFMHVRRIAILEDNDEPGRERTERIIETLRRMDPAPDIRVVAFPELDERGDVSDWLAQDKSRGRVDLLARIEAAKPFYSKPKPAPLRDWIGQPIPQPEYTVPGRVLAEQVFILSGEGGEGKSNILHQLCAAHPLGETWLGCTVRQGPAIYLECEDTLKALHWRQDAINQHYGVGYGALADAGLQLFSMIENDTILAAPNRRNGILEATAAYDWLFELAGDIKPVLIGIASTSNVFAGSENDRAEVQQFVKLLGRIALVTGGSVVLVTHPSMTGAGSSIASHEGLSGTTQWHNAVRGRAVMKTVAKAADEDEGEVSSESRVREIKFHKNQYGPPIASSFVRWQNGLFLPVDGMHSLDAAERAAKADRVFIALLRRWTEQNRQVSVNRSSTYAPAVFAAQSEASGAGLTSKDLARAMERLLRDGLIENCIVTKGKETRSHLAIGRTEFPTLSDGR